MDEWADARERMVVEQIEARGIDHPGVLAALRRVPRHLFVPPAMVTGAYWDRALPIGNGQTISQPYMVARMTAALAGGLALGRVLEIGTGSGYQAAVLSLMANEVISIERQPGLARAARERLAKLGFDNITVIEGDGTADAGADGLYDGILVTAGAPRVPAGLTSLLAQGSRLVIPVGSRFQQVLAVITHVPGGFERHDGEECVFVPLIGTDGWTSDYL